MRKYLDALAAALGYIPRTMTPTVRYDAQTREIHLEFGSWCVHGFICPTPDGPIKGVTWPHNPLLDGPEAPLPYVPPFAKKTRSA